ncbi:1,4-dihydroxy-2-naphthoate octaprenyltransferase [Bifidobacterium pullorum subsp. saeculare]|uniref:1,4-dihydroxy-2-naphthoate octaprenyltransferase n=1 Tax=Bifidobacterium pullorum subsp. saeculare TaxID=78257 RepID=A0A938WWY2_9BIFI|nr:1,4-dihydroxy-2-naphthoate octaprenyltransferase [Bifidobacterium pullorum]MBM6699789.1 1,4-dihydroxy-2-naphthoate octaprenyltransferase [Bifidobacterium pullorum subsp. saeculare]
MDARMWVSGAWPRTLPASVAPVLMGAACAWMDVRTQQRQCATNPGAATLWNAYGGTTPFPACSDSFIGGAAWFWTYVPLCLAVAIALQVAVNYANDYSDGIRGTDDGRAAAADGGPTPPSAAAPARLVASGVPPRNVLRAAGIAAAVACVAGLAVVVLSGVWALLAVGVASLIAGWCYTGGKHPYGYAGLGEPFVFVFFGPVAVVGTYLAMVGSLGGTAGATLPLAAATAGLDAVALLMVNNLRDIPADRTHGKRTYAVRVGYAAAKRTLAVVILISILLSLWGCSGKVLYVFGMRVGWLPPAVPLGVVLVAGAAPLVVALRRDDLRRALPAVSLFALVTAVCWVAACLGQGAYVVSLP